jgi:hypothetical protein
MANSVGQTFSAVNTDIALAQLSNEISPLQSGGISRSLFIFEKLDDLRFTHTPHVFFDFFGSYWHAAKCASDKKSAYAERTRPEQTHARLGVCACRLRESYKEKVCGARAGAGSPTWSAKAAVIQERSVI